MSKLTILITCLAMSIFQLYWLARVWNRDGFFAAIKLFLFAAVALAALELLALAQSA